MTRKRIPHHRLLSQRNAEIDKARGPEEFTLSPPGHHPADHGQVLHAGRAEHPQHLLQAQLPAAPRPHDQLPLCPR